jgi:hypothetical protein
MTVEIMFRCSRCNEYYDSEVVIHKGKKLVCVHCLDEMATEREVCPLCGRKKKKGRSSHKSQVTKPA